jgi:hypothetical protein
LTDEAAAPATTNDWGLDAEEGCDQGWELDLPPWTNLELEHANKGRGCLRGELQQLQTRTWPRPGSLGRRATRLLLNLFLLGLSYSGRGSARGAQRPLGSGQRRAALGWGGGGWTPTGAATDCGGAAMGE